MAVSISKQLMVEATMENMEQVIGLVEEILDDAECPMKIRMKIVVCVEELYVNVVNYAYGDKVGLCTLEVEAGEQNEKGYVRITLRDGGIPFDPLSREEPDISLSADDREIGGLGIFMVKKIMDRVEYTYKMNENILTMEKNW